MTSSYATPKLPPRTIAQLDQGLFDFLIPYRKPLLKPHEVAKCIDKATDFVYDLIERCKLETLEQSAKGERKVYSVTRRSVLFYLVQTAHFDPTDFQQYLRTALESLDAPLLDYVIREATAIRTRLHRS